jgi:hypothetical protein
MSDLSDSDAADSLRGDALSGLDGDASFTVDVPSEGCRVDGTFAFTFSASSLEPYEGRILSVAVIAPELDIASPDRLRPVLVSAVIEHGAVGFFCPNALIENLAYPSYAAFIDVDEDGTCGGPDIGMQVQLYGWVEAVTAAPTADVWRLVGDLSRPVGLAEAADFCQAYFPVRP